MITDENKPYLRFFYEEKEDRNATLETGMYVPKNVAMVEITQVGGKSVFVDEAEGWLKKITENSLQGRYSREWVKTFKDMYELFKEGEEIPEEGISIRMCLMFSPAEQRSILNANIRTLEDLAKCNEEGLQAMGPGGRLLRDRARTAIDQSKDSGKVAADVERLKVQNDALQQRVEDLLSAMREQGIEEKRKPGRPRVSNE